MRDQWRGVVAVILALGVVGVLVAALFLAAANPHHNGLTTEEANAASTILGAVIGALAVYLGGSAEPRPRRGERPPGSVGPSGDEPATREDP